MLDEIKESLEENYIIQWPIKFNFELVTLSNQKDLLFIFVALIFEQNMIIYEAPLYYYNIKE